MTSYNFGLPFRSGQALTTGFATLVFVTSIAKQSRANGNVSLGHSPTTNVGNPSSLVEIVLSLAQKQWKKLEYLHRVKLKVYLEY
jgi:hypothetical protein